jgi:hypothetical protein
MDVVLKGWLRRLCTGKGRIINSEPVSSSNNNFLLLSNNCGLVSSPNNCGFVSSPNNRDLVSSPNNRDLVSSPNNRDLVSSPNNRDLVSSPNNHGLVSLPQKPESLHNNNGRYTIITIIIIHVDAYEKKKNRIHCGCIWKEKK